MVFISEQCVLCERLGELFNKRHRVWFCLFPPATNKPVFVYSRQAAGSELLIRSQEGFPTLSSVVVVVVVVCCCCCRWWWRPGNPACAAHMTSEHEWLSHMNDSLLLLLLQQQLCIYCSCRNTVSRVKGPERCCECDPVNTRETNEEMLLK